MNVSGDSQEDTHTQGSTHTHTHTNVVGKLYMGNLQCNLTSLNLQHQKFLHWSENLKTVGLQLTKSPLLSGTTAITFISGISFEV